MVPEDAVNNNNGIINSNGGNDGALVPVEDSGPYGNDGGYNNAGQGAGNPGYGSAVVPSGGELVSYAGAGGSAVGGGGGGLLLDSQGEGSGGGGGSGTGATTSNGIIRLPTKSFTQGNCSQRGVPR